ncbi:MAG: hypothetical protein R2704_06440 [Microthrixaceae bacterium]
MLTATLWGESSSDFSDARVDATTSSWSATPAIRWLLDAEVEAEVAVSVFGPAVLMGPGYPHPRVLNHRPSIPGRRTR